MTGSERDREPGRPAIRSTAPGFRLDRERGKLAGVCAGIGDWLNVDPLFVRLVFVAGALLGFGSFILVYLVIWLLAR